MGRLREALAQEKTRAGDLSYQLEVEKVKREGVEDQVRRSEMTNRDLQKDLTDLQQREEASRARISDLQAALDRAQTTIKVQSSQIRGPGSASRQLTQSTAYHQPDLPYRPRGRGRGTHARPPPQNLAIMPPQNPYPPDLGQFSAPPTPSGPSFPPTAMIRTAPDPNKPNFHYLFNVLINGIQAWVEDFANVPGHNEAAHATIRSLVDVQRCPDLEIIINLLADGNSRNGAVTKLIVYQITNFSFVPMVIKGFKQGYDDRFAAEQQKIFPGVQESVRFESRSTIAAITSEVISDPGWKAHIDRQHANKLRHCWHIVQPLLAPHINQQDAWRKLFDLWDQSIQLGLQMLQKISIFDINYPVPGQNTYFNPANMTCADPQYSNQTAQNLARMQTKVRLAYAPVITERDLESLSWEPQTRLFARVLLMI